MQTVFPQLSAKRAWIVSFVWWSPFFRNSRDGNLLRITTLCNLQDNVFFVSCNPNWRAFVSPCSIVWSVVFVCRWTSFSTLIHFFRASSLSAAFLSVASFATLHIPRERVISCDSWQSSPGIIHRALDCYCFNVAWCEDYTVNSVWVVTVIYLTARSLSLDRYDSSWLSSGEFIFVIFYSI